MIQHPGYDYISSYYITYHPQLSERPLIQGPWPYKWCISDLLWIFIILVAFVQNTYPIKLSIFAKSFQISNKSFKTDIKYNFKQYICTYTYKWR